MVLLFRCNLLAGELIFADLMSPRTQACLELILTHFKDFNYVKATPWLKTSCILLKSVMKSQTIIICIGLLTLMMLAISCSKDLEKSATVSYQDDLLPIINSSCAGSYCHATPEYFTEYVNIKKTVDEGLLWEKVIVEKSMPPSFNVEVPGSAPISEDQRMMFATWIEEGALNN